ncbi:Holliday junction branch migration protein RuvA [Chondromyces crocatus]|uniref:Holliday junction branch migration complex subunit RuvA n=1 Tax=Chondromyces crocatus TaxID=52 RepID=A0A0K1ENY8_CHOCO|nr:Holliday junction branch migration protein RuvA [Chondromyces crocatus]AKT42620.1 Holliday junction DNA helicase RuvA [Chondromyces crocatus]
MIGRLTGHVVEEEADGTTVLDVSGVGYEVMVPLGALGRARAIASSSSKGAGEKAHAVPHAGGAAPLRETITLFVHTHVREDAFLLYGFAAREERAAFRALISVSSIGPKIAMAILSVLTAAELAAVIARKEVARLTKIPGVGKKTAERLVLELKDKLIELPSAPAGTPSLPSAPAPSAHGDLLKSALTGMGYRPAEAERAVTALASRIDTAPLDEMIREALGLLSR